ncbi:MAG: peptide-N-glycosidase F-related protein [Polyangiaceae bacterium]
MVGRSLVVASFLVWAAGCSKSKPLQPVGAGGVPASAGTAGAASDAGSTSNGIPALTVFDAARISSNPSDPNFQALSADLDLSDGPYESATLTADLGTTCFPFSSWADDPPPKGENWPADCDAFDRNFELSLDGPEPGDASTSIGSGDSGTGGESGAGGDGGASGDGGAGGITVRATPGLEIVRAITPFGGPMHIERDITAIANGLPGMHRIHARIATWADAAGLVTGSNAGWNVTLKVALKKGPALAPPLAVIPLFYGDLSTMNEVSTSFTVPKGTTRGYLEYRTTGHGGAAGNVFACSGPAEEFCKRQHTIKLDGVTIKSFTPWVTCASHCTLAKSGGDAGFDYCEENPCGAVESVKAPRANWCPGAETAPVTIDTPGLATPGVHDVSFHVSEIADGGNVRISLTYYAFSD